MADITVTPTGGSPDTLENHLANALLPGPEGPPGPQGPQGPQGDPGTITIPLELEGDPAGGNMLMVKPTGDSSDLKSSGGAVLIDNTSNTRLALNVYSNQSNQDANDPLVRIRADHTSFSQGCLEVINDGTSGNSYNIKLAGPAPQIEFVENDQTGRKGKFELTGNGNLFRISGRKADDSGFENVVKLQAATDGGELWLDGYLQMTESTPASPATGEVNLYLKNGKLVIQYDDAGTMRWFTIDLTATGAQEVQSSTSAP